MPTPSRFWKILREPLLHFLVLGLVVAGLVTLFEYRAEDNGEPYLVEVSSADLEWTRTMWRKRTGREPDVEELRGMVNQLIRERVLAREATRLGLDENDQVLRQRLTQKMEFLLRDLSELRIPAEEDLRTFLEENADKYRLPARLFFSQIYFNADERGYPAAEKAAADLVADLNERGVGPAEAQGLGDPIMLDHGYEDVPLTDVAHTFGRDFATALGELPPGSWQGPVRSGFGLHAVFVSVKTPGRTPSLDEIRERLETDWMYREQQELSEQAYQGLRARYRVLVEGLPYHRDEQQ
jgi:hypothetical protein